MTEDLMLKWIDQVWSNHANQFEKSLLVLDQFSVHKLATVKKRLQELNTDIILIPPGLTCKLQPLDVYVNKPLKDQLRKLWSSYILDPILDKKGSVITKLLIK